MLDEEAVTLRWLMVCDSLDERQRRFWAGVEATAFGKRGVSAVARATGMSRRRVTQAMEDLRETGGRVPVDVFTGTAPRRGSGAGRKPVTSTWPTLPRDVLAEFSGGRLLKGEMACFHWSTQSARGLAERLQANHRQSVSATHLAGLLRQLGFRIGKDTRVKPLHTAQHRHVQFETVFQAMKQAAGVGQGVLYLDLDKRVLPSIDVNNAIDQVLSSAFPEGASGTRVSPDANAIWAPARQACREGTLLAKTTKDLASWRREEPDVHTAAFALQVVRRWWDQTGSDLYSGSGEMLLCVNGFGQEGELQEYWIRELWRCTCDLQIGLRICFVPIGIARLTPVTSQPATVLLMQDGRGEVARHKVELTVLPRYIGSPDLRGTPIFNDLGSAARWRVSSSEMKSIKLRRDKTMAHWNFSVG